MEQTTTAVSETGTRPQDDSITVEDPAELPSTTSGLAPNSNSSSGRPNLRSTVSSAAEPGQGRQSRDSDVGTKKRSGFKEHIQKVRDQARKLPSGGRSRTEDVGWVDGTYYEANAKDGQTRQKPVFSLSKPLPHVVRWPREPKNAAPVTKPPSKKSSDDPDDLAERGEAGEEDPKTVSPEVVTEENATHSDEGARPRRTAAGALHFERRNDAGQPVFDYQPRDEISSMRKEHAPIEMDQLRNNDGPNYGIDSEPLGGRREHEDVEKGGEDPNEYKNWWARTRAKHPEPLAEFLATGIAVFMGLAATLSVNLSADQPVKYGTYETSCWAWGFAWMFGIYLGGGVSGAHMNPAISISLTIFRGFPWRSCLIYIAAQFLGGIVAGALAYGIYRDTILHVDPTMADTAKTFFSSPQEWVSTGTAFFDQVVGSAIMMIAVFALGDDQNNPPGAGMHALVLGLLLTTLKFSLGYNIGAALNPASDFGPRLVAWLVGYRSSEVFSDGWWFKGPFLATLVGSVIGCLLYDGLIFNGSESPVNYRPKDGFQLKKRFRKAFEFKKRTRRFLDLFRKWKSG